MHHIYCSLAGEPLGFVHDVVDGSNFHAIEGNTSSSSAGSQSNGGEVCLKLRRNLEP